MRKVLIFIFVYISVFGQGNLVIIGGGERTPEILNKIIELSENGKLLIIPNASNNPIETAKYQVDQFKEAGCKSVDFLYYNDYSNIDLSDIFFKDVRGIFFSGGDQNKLAAEILNTPLLNFIRKVFNDGGLISGTSAGAAVMSEIMITGDEMDADSNKTPFNSIKRKNILISEGFGFIKNAIIDQHFIARKRNNRLISVVLDNPQCIGIGIDESTAIFVNSYYDIEVIGNYQIIIYQVIDQESISVNENNLYSAEHIKMSILTNGSKYNLLNRTVIK